jgi:hypothetical protein
LAGGEDPEVCDWCGRRFSWPVPPGDDCAARHPPADLARQCAEEIEADVEDRRGIGHELAEVDDEIREEIREAWAGIIRRYFKRAQKEG